MIADPAGSGVVTYPTRRCGAPSLSPAVTTLAGAPTVDSLGTIAAGVLHPGRPAVYDLADGPKALAEPESRATVGKLALRP
ncbi:hypothetical protein ACFYSC_32270 [Streptosporangium sp. NPDC004379]|uniref:hypothetical protein n=1 Tax=Streptosporangium sp. NPDC004379 TaxID=3366189 RepID=UPI00367CBA31